MFFGIAILIIGIAFLLQNLGLISGNFWDILWPLLIIFIGLSILSRRKHCWFCGKHHGHHDHWHKFGDEMKERFGSHHEHHEHEHEKEENEEDKVESEKEEEHKEE